jgi:hypothetical protein
MTATFRVAETEATGRNAAARIAASAAPTSVLPLDGAGCSRLGTRIRLIGLPPHTPAAGIGRGVPTLRATPSAGYRAEE